jgi:subtilisin family serine protease
MRNCGQFMNERGSALWGKGSRGAAVLVAVLAVFSAFAASARADGSAQAWVPSYLVAQAQANPDQLFNVVVQGRPGDNSASVAAIFTSARSAGAPGQLKAQFQSINGVAGSITGKDLLKLAQSNHVASIVPDVKESSQDYQSQLVWQSTVNLLPTLGTLLAPAKQAPAIAIVDSGVDASKLQDFGARVVASVDLSGTAQAADDEGHGTMVAGLAAGAGLYPGVARNASLVSLRTSDRTGASRMSDVIRACDWILQNKDKYGIRVANFSMRSSVPSSFRYDPLDKAVESLWFHGVVVVAAVGNYGVAGQPVKIQ